MVRSSPDEINCYVIVWSSVRENRLENTSELITNLEQELEAPGSAPLNSMYTTQHQSGDSADSSNS